MTEPSKQRQPESVKRMLRRAKARAAKKLQDDGYKVFRLDHREFHILALKNHRIKIIKVDTVESQIPSRCAFSSFVDEVEIWAAKPGSEKFFVIDVKR